MLGITNITQNLCNTSFRQKKHDELTVRNHHQRPIGTTPLPNVNYSSNGKEKVDGQNNHPKNVGKFKQAQNNKFRDQSSGKGKKSFKCHSCGGPNHIAKKCNIPPPNT
jgi:hypothetical protein